MDEQKKQLVEKLKTANNILVTVRNNPNVDLLSACIGLTLILNKLDKHATAVFSGDIPSTMEFLKPEDTLEKNTDSLRDFIIALDKSKADKLRYKVEDKSVRIFITPYKTSISQDDLEFSQGDFNVDVVVALGAHEQQELDQAITEHGRILHDATVTSINNANNGNLGSINWQDTNASSISELVARLVKDLSKDKEKTGELLDEQIATALLTGIVAETDRFSNSHTTASTMSVSAELMAAGANQQLVATKLQESPAAEFLPPVSSGVAPSDAPKSDDGTLEIAHEGQPEGRPSNSAPSRQDPDMPYLSQEEHKVIEPPKDSDTQSDFSAGNESTAAQDSEHDLPAIKQLHQPDSMLPAAPEKLPAEAADMTGLGYAADQGGMLTANTRPEPLDGPMEAMTPAPAPDRAPLMSHDYEGKDEAAPAPEDQPAAPAISPLGEAEVTAQPTPAAEVPNPTFEPATPSTPSIMPTPSVPSPEAAPADDSNKTLSQLEQEVHSPHAAAPLDGDIDSARDEVLKALQESASTPEPIEALGAQPVFDVPHDSNDAPLPPAAPSTELHLDANGNLQLPSYPPAAVNEPAPNPMSPADQPLDMPLPPSSGLQVPPPQTSPPTNTQNQNPNSPPPVPPPMMPPFTPQ
jgi:hypothetical protein